MALTLEESAELMADLTFRGRVKAAALKYADFLHNQTGNSQSKRDWIKLTQNSPDLVASQLSNPVVLDANVQANGAQVTDTDLQSAVEATAQQMM